MASNNPSNLYAAGRRSQESAKLTVAGTVVLSCPCQHEKPMSDFDGAVEALRRLSYERRIFALAESVKRDQDSGIPLNGADAIPDGHLNGTTDFEAAENGAPLSSFNLLPDL